MQDTTHISSSSLSLLDTHFSGPSHLSHAYVGGLAGLLMDVVLHPLDTVRTRMKTNVHESVKLFSQIRTMHTHEGALSFSKGFTCTLAGAFVANGAYFYVYEKLRYIIKQQRALPNDVTPFVAAFAGALVSNCVYYPFIVIRTRMQLNTIHYDYAHFFDGIRNALKHEGVRKIYTGSPVFFLQTAIDMSLTFGFYELLHRTLEPIFPSKSEVNVPLSIASSVGAASLSAIIVNPFDVVVSRMQTMNTSIHGPCSVGGMIKRIYRYEGVRGFMKGVTGTMSHYSLAALILFPTYEILGQYYKIEKCCSEVI